MENKKTKGVKRYMVIYVFGKKSEQTKYENNEPVEFVKIGQTEYDGELKYELIKKAAKDRYRSKDSHTCLPYPCNVYEYLVFPNINGKKLDDGLRIELCMEVYTHEHSMISDDNCDIPAGKEFVYGTNRNHLVNAVRAYTAKVLCNAANANDVQACSRFNEHSLKREFDFDNNNINNEKTEVEVVHTKNESSVDHVQKNVQENNPDAMMVGKKIYLTKSRSPQQINIDGFVAEGVYIGGGKVLYNGEALSVSNRKFIDLLGQVSLNGYDQWRDGNGRTLKSGYGIFSDTISKQPTEGLSSADGIHIIVNITSRTYSYNGDTIHDISAIQMLRNVIKTVGYEKVASLNIMCGGHTNLVSKLKRPGTTLDGENWQKMIDGWYIYNNMDSKSVKKHIKAISEKTGIDIAVED